MKETWMTVKESDWVNLRDHLLRDDALERQAFLELGALETERRTELFVHRVQPVADEEYLSQGPCYARPKPTAVTRAYASFGRSGITVHGHAHSHPFCLRPSFSPVDRRTLDEMRRGLLDLSRMEGLPEPVLCFQVVMGREENGFQGVLVDTRGQELGTLSVIRVVGLKGIRVLTLDMPNQLPPIINDERLERNVRWLGPEGQRKIATARVAICGLGGVGAMLVANIRGLGFGQITLVDPDRVELSNLNRLAGAGQEDVGAFKVDVFRREIRRARPETEVHALRCEVEDPEAQAHLKQADVILSAVDGMRARAELQVLAARFLKPLFDLGSGILVDETGEMRRMGSQIIVYLPGGPCLACQGMDLFRPTEGIAGEVRRKTGYVVGTDVTPTSAATINSVAAGWAADLLIRYLTGISTIPLYTEINQWAGQVRTLAFRKKDHCPICGADGIEGKGEDRTMLVPCPVPAHGLTIEAMEEVPT